MSNDNTQLILIKLKERNEKQRDSFAELISAHNKWYEYVEAFKTKNVQLVVENERLKQDHQDLLLKGAPSGSGGGGGGEKTHVWEQKVYKLQEELTELHRKKGENAQKIIDLNNALQEKDKELQMRQTRIEELQKKLDDVMEANRRIESNLVEATTTNQMLTDEQHALQLAFTSLEEKFRKMQEENNELVCRWMALKARDAEKMNQENEISISKRQQKLQKQLAEASMEPKEVHMPAPGREAGLAPTVCFAVMIPERALCQFDAHDGEVNTVQWSPNGRFFASGGSDRKLKLWEVSSGKQENRGILLGSNAAVMSVEFDPEESHVLASSNDFASRIWSLQDQRLRHTLTGHSGKVLAAKYLGDVTKVVSGSHDRTLKIWDLKSKACIKTIFAGSSCNDLVASDGFNIISAHFDRKVRFWDTRADSTSKEINLQGRVTSLCLSQDRFSLLGCTRDDTLKIIDLRQNQVTATLSADGFHVGSDWTRAVFSPDGQYAMAGSQDGSLFIWDVTKRNVTKVLHEHSNGIMACAWHPGGSMLLSCDKGRKVILWSDF